jgi:hypothetical protein
MRLLAQAAASTHFRNSLRRADMRVKLPFIVARLAVPNALCYRFARPFCEACRARAGASSRVRRVEYAPGKRQLRGLPALLMHTCHLLHRHQWYRLLGDQRQMMPFTEEESKWILEYWLDPANQYSQGLSAAALYLGGMNNVFPGLHSLLYCPLLLERSYGGGGEAIFLLLQGFFYVLVVAGVLAVLVKLSNRAEEVYEDGYRRMMKKAGIGVAVFFVI